MPASDATAPSTVMPANSIWRQHEAQIRNLYLNENKALKEVKEQMEKNGFPETSLSTWESRIRVDLKIRKNLNAPDWRLIHRALVPRLERPGKKRLSRPTTIRFHGREIQLDKAWKEIRRTNAHTEPLQSVPLGDLPPGIEVRTPSPIASPILMAEQSSLPLAFTSPMNSRSTAFQLYTPQPVIRVGSPHITSSLSMFSSNLPTTPWVSLCVNIRNLFHDGIPTRLLDAWKSLEWWKIVPVGRNLRAQDIQDFQFRVEQLPANSPKLPRPSPDLGHRLVTSRGNILLTDFVSTAAYLLSNGLHDTNDGDKGLQLLCSLFEHDVQLFTQILQCGSSTGRATWESLMNYAKNRYWNKLRHNREMSKDHYDKRICRILLDVGIRSSWVDVSDLDVLVFALQVDCPPDILENILDQYLRSGQDHSSGIVNIAISKSYQKGQTRITGRLVRHFDVNSIFWYFVQEACLDNDFTGNHDSRWHLIELLLSNGADVDSDLLAQTDAHPSCVRWYNESEINRALRPTILDYSFRANRPLFKRLDQHSKVPKTALTKSGLLTSLDKGPGALRDYLRTRVPAIDLSNWRIIGSILRFLLHDQLDPMHWGSCMGKGNKAMQRSPRSTPRDRASDMDFKIVRNFVQYVDELNWDSLFLPRIDLIFNEVIYQLILRPEQLADDGGQLLDILMHKGADITDDHLGFAVELEGARILNWLRPRVKDFSLKAAGALAQAVRVNDIQAVRFLIQSGVDPKDSVDLSEAVLQNNFELVEFLVQNGVDPDDPASLAVAAQQNDLEVLKFLLQSGANPTDSAALAIAARQNNFEMVKLLLQSGANPKAFVSAGSANLHVNERHAFNDMTQGSPEQAYSVQAVAAGIGTNFAKRCTLKMSQFLAKTGAKFAIGPNDLTPFAFTMFQLETGWGDPELFDKVELSLRTLKQSKDWARPPAFLLEICVNSWTRLPKEFQQRLKLFEHFLDEGAEVNPGSPLALLAGLGAPKRLVERVLGLGAELDAYTAVRPIINFTHTALQGAASQGNVDLVYLFLEQGANVNSPARDAGGKTALQAICSWNPATEKEHRRKMTVCDILLNSGAEINAAPASRSGVTALQAAVLSGDLEVAAILIRNGAHVNAPPYRYPDRSGCHFKFSVLDLAAKYGRLDIAKLLLNANAVSGLRGITGYDGAINLAQNQAITSLICEHLENGVQQGVELLDFDTAPEGYDHHGFDTDRESSDDECHHGLRRHPRSADNDRSSVGEEPSEPDSSEYDPLSEWDSLASPTPGLAPEYALTEDGVLDIQWDIQPVPDFFMEALTGTLGAEAVPGLQVVRNDPTNGWISHPGTGYILPAEHTLLPEDEWMLHNPFEAWAEISGDGAFWQQEIEMPGLDVGLVTFDAGRQLPSSYQLGEPGIDEQNAAEPDHTRQLQRG